MRDITSNNVCFQQKWNSLDSVNQFHFVPYVDII